MRRLQAPDHLAGVVGIGVAGRLCAFERQDVERDRVIVGIAAAAEDAREPDPDAARAAADPDAEARPAAAARAGVRVPARDLEVVAAVRERQLGRPVERIILDLVARGRRIAGERDPVAIALELLVAIAEIIGRGPIGRRRRRARGEAEQDRHDAEPSRPNHHELSLGRVIVGPSRRMTSRAS